MDRYEKLFEFFIIISMIAAGFFIVRLGYKGKAQNTPDKQNNVCNF